MSTTLPMVSVVVPARNEAARIGACLDALLGQDYPRDRYHILVVDNASTDGTAARTARYPVTRIVEPVRGIARARNTGIRAARGECIAFTDADCVPCPHWLRALVEGWEDTDTGCFVGEIAGTPSRRLIAQYVEDRRLISQRQLLAAMIPVAATGSIAFRRHVFSSVGLFDETFRYGEDADLTWRLQKWGGFGIRYNPRAIVRHPHPDTLPALLRRTRHEGLGLAAFRLRHADDIRRPGISRARYQRALLKAVLGLSTYPLRVANEKRRRLPLHKALAFPLLDKMHSFALMSGIAAGLPRGRPPAISPARRDPADPAMPCPAADHRDQLLHNLATDPLFLHPCDSLTGQVRGELETLCLEILAAVPDASILLTGSLSVGEGSWRQTGNEPVCQSDYDLVVLSALPPVSGLRAIRGRMRSLLEEHPASADLDIAYVWLPFLRRGWITTGGRLLAGDPDRAAWLPGLPAPRASSAMTRAFLSLAGARLAPDRFPDRISKALVQAAQAVLLDLCRGQPRREWVGLLGRSVIRDRMLAHAGTFGRDTAGAVARAVAWLDGEHGSPWVEAEQARVLETLRQLRARLQPPSGWKQGLRVIAQPSRSEPRLIAALDALAACWLDGPAPDADLLEALPGPGKDQSRAAPLARYRLLHDSLAGTVRCYPHKIRWTRKEGFIN